MQFLWGLAAGIVVGLVMEWVIDWAGLMPRRSRPDDRRTRSRDATASKQERRGGDASGPQISQQEPPTGKD